MRIIVLGSAAGGGFPQWNCNSEYCRLVRQNSPLAKSRTQSSLAVTSNGLDFVLFNCSPDLRQQINQTEALHPHSNGHKRNSPIKAVILTNADVDHIAGLLTMRESEPFHIYASREVQETLANNTVFNVLNPDYVKRSTFDLSQPFTVTDGNNQSLGLEIEAFSVPGKVALFLEDKSKGTNFGTREGDTVGLYVKDLNNNTDFYYVPACAQLPDELKQRLNNNQLLFFDGTLFHDDEMITMKVGHKTGQRMGHMSIGEKDGTLAKFSDINIQQKIFIHINNTNPVLIENSPERKMVEEAGWTVAWDGETIEL